MENISNSSNLQEREFGRLRKFSSHLVDIHGLQGLLRDSQSPNLHAVDMSWLSVEQKGFLPEANGIQEHTHLLQCAVEEAKINRRDLCVTWLDLTNGFGSIPQSILAELIQSLPLPQHLKHSLLDIYSDNSSTFAVGKQDVTI